jgi:Fe-S cluster assembly protein SufD
VTANIAIPQTGVPRAHIEEFSQSRNEPDWLLQLRLRAWETFERLPMPDQRTEGWRRTSLRGLDLSSIDPLSCEASLTVRGPGVKALSFKDALRDPRLEAIIRRHFAEVVPMDSDKFVAFHYALFNAAAVVYVPRGVVLEEPITLEWRGDGPVLAHTVVVLEEDSHLAAVVEKFSGSAPVASTVAEQVVAANAHLRYLQLQQFGTGTWNFSTQRTQLAQDASLRTLNVALGGRMSRNTVQVVLNGRGSQADLLGIVDVAGRQHVDFQTLQDHFGDATRSDLVIHNALRERSSTNFTGLIRINKSAHQTESSQEQKNILLSDASKADSDPKLEILNNDVIRCTHGAAVGPVDEEMVFYLQSRGLDRTTAEQLIVDGFFQSTLARLELPTVEQVVWAALNDRSSAR